MSRRVLPALALAVALCVSVSGCGGGDPKAHGASPRPTSSGTPTTSPYGEPAVASVDEAFAAMRSYNRRNNAAIRKVFRNHDVKLWKGVDVGPILAMDAFDTRSLANGYHVAQSPWNFGKPIRVSAPASKTWPKEILVAAAYRGLGPRRDGTRQDRRSVPLSVLVQPAPGAPWEHEAASSALKARLPRSAAFGGDSVASASQARHALALARELPAYWRSGRKPAGFADTRGIDAPRMSREASLKSGTYRDVVYDARLLGGAKAVHAYRVEGGVIALATYRLDQTWIAAHGTIHWVEQAASVWGSRSASRLTSTHVASASFFVPDVGKARPLGYLQDYALF